MCSWPSINRASAGVAGFSLCRKFRVGRCMKNIKKRVKISRLIEWWKKWVCPTKSLCFNIKDGHRQTGDGLLKLHDDIQTCGYEDVQVMWEMLRKSETEVTDNKGISKLKQWPSWRVVKDDSKSANA